MIRRFAAGWRRECGGAEQRVVSVGAISKPQFAAPRTGDRVKSLRASYRRAGLAQVAVV